MATKWKEIELLMSPGGLSDATPDRIKLIFFFVRGGEAAKRETSSDRQNGQTGMRYGRYYLPSLHLPPPPVAVANNRWSTRSIGPGYSGYCIEVTLCMVENTCSTLANTG
ncbi:hypothetical protein RRG08_023723 [Elysia crispata]|uniref:Uncharacterized protein n=1 Tax=Elysia crispata TaxID=231223 RepID=A0AAE0Z0A2_9GAST|nr:hypothetical protein RRG08_023723 [Elysia crispata]